MDKKNPNKTHTNKNKKTNHNKKPQRLLNSELLQRKPFMSRGCCSPLDLSLLVQKEKDFYTDPVFIFWLWIKKGEQTAWWKCCRENKIIKWTFCLTKELNVSHCSGWTAGAVWQLPWLLRYCLSLIEVGLKRKAFFSPHPMGLKMPLYVNTTEYLEKSTKSAKIFLCSPVCPSCDLFTALNFQISGGISVNHTHPRFVLLVHFAIIAPSKDSDSFSFTLLWWSHVFNPIPPVLLRTAPLLLCSSSACSKHWLPGVSSEAVCQFGAKCCHQVHSQHLLF